MQPSEHKLLANLTSLAGLPHGMPGMGLGLPPGAGKGKTLRLVLFKSTPFHSLSLVRPRLKWVNTVP